MGLDVRDILQWVHRERDLRNYEQRAGEFCHIMKACVDLHIPKVKCRLGAMISKSDKNGIPWVLYFGRHDPGSATLNEGDTVKSSDKHRASFIKLRPSTQTIGLMLVRTGVG